MSPGPAARAAPVYKALACRFLDLVSAGDLDGLSRIIAPTWTRQGGPPGLPAGPEGLRVLFAGFGRIEQRWAIDDVIADGRIEQTWRNADDLGRLLQLGARVVPGPPEEPE